MDFGWGFDSFDDGPADIVTTPAEKSKGRSGDLKQPEMEEKGTEYQMKTDGELEGMISRIKNNILTMGHKLPDKGEKYKAALRGCVAEVERRKRSRFHKDDEREKEEDDVKRMRILKDELEAEKKLTNQVQGKLIDAETKIVQLEAHVLDLHKKLCDSSLQLGVAERKCASVENDSKWLLQEGLPFLVKRVVKELIKENFMTVSEIRALHQRDMKSDSS